MRKNHQVQFKAIISVSQIQGSYLHKEAGENRYLIRTANGTLEVRNTKPIEDSGETLKSLYFNNKGNLVNFDYSDPTSKKIVDFFKEHELVSNVVDGRELNGNLSTAYVLFSDLREVSEVRYNSIKNKMAYINRLNNLPEQQQLNFCHALGEVDLATPQDVYLFLYDTVMNELERVERMFEDNIALIYHTILNKAYKMGLLFKDDMGLFTFGKVKLGSEPNSVFQFFADNEEKFNLLCQEVYANYRNYEVDSKFRPVYTLDKSKINEPQEEAKPTEGVKQPNTKTDKKVV